MLVSKFSVPIIRYTSRNNLKNILVRCASKKLSSDDIKRSCPSREKIGPVIRSRSEENRAALLKCPKKNCKTESTIVPPKCSSQISVVYLKSLKTVENEAKKLSSLIEKSMDRILKDFETEINHKKAEQATKRQEILKDVNHKIWELINLDGYFGIKKRNEIWMINYKICNELKLRKDEKAEDLKFLKTKKETLMSETKSKTTGAIDLLKSCKMCNSPNCLKDCVEDKTNEAIKILECANKTVLQEIVEMKTFKINAVNNFESCLKNIMDRYKLRLEKFSENLTLFLDDIKKRRKIKRKWLKIW